MEQDEDNDINQSNDDANRSPAYSPTLVDSKTGLDESSHASTSKSPKYVPSDSERRVREQQKRSMSLDSYDSRDSRNKSRSSRSFDRSDSSSRERNLNSIEIKGLTKMVFATHLEQIFTAYGQIEEIFMPFDHYTEENLGRAFITYKSSLSAEKAKDCMDQGQIDGAIISVRCEDIRIDELKTSYDSTSRTEPRRSRRNSNRDERDHRSTYRNNSNRERYPTHPHDRDRRRSESRIRSRSSSPYQ